MKIWVVGKEGLLARALQKQMKCDATSSCEVDITIKNQVMEFCEQMRPTHVINSAAYTNVDLAEIERAKAFAINAEGAENLAEAASRYGARFIHVSTDYVFDGKATEPYLEEAPCAPLNVYGLSKREGELRVMAAMPTACVIRTSWLSGPITIMKWLQEKEHLQMVEDQLGKPTWVEDLAEAIAHLLEHFGVIHFANEGGGSRYQIACDLRDWMLKKGMPVRCKSIEPVLSREFPRPAVRPAYSMLDTTLYGKPRHWLEALDRRMR